MGFEKRDIILLAGIILLMLGLLPFMPAIYAIIIALALFFGIKIFVNKRKERMKNQFGEGFCVECGQKIINKKCPNCDKTTENKV